ncbi:MAG TPA: hypothetical protein VHE30_16785 [Polyangiaceae bacterium]|nr:hypothetical protein [Polyangiaceae bacterium]
MAKPPSPLLGFNNNVKHQGRIFHVQTEDSGVMKPHILTHLFADGGRIIKSTRTDYSEHVGRSDMGTVVRRLMKEQHKAMFIALRDGQLDARIVEVLGPSPESGEAPTEAPRKSKTPPAPAAAAKRRSKPPPTVPEAKPVNIASLPPQEEAKGKKEKSHEPVPRPASPTLTDLVLADLEAAKARGMPSVTTTAAKPAAKGTPVLGTPAVQSRPPPSGRYAASRPAAIFSPSPDQSSIFGGASISEQSLDEVILSYLAEDLTEPED